MLVKLTRGIYPYIPEWNNNKTEQENSQVSFNLRKPTIPEREKIVKVDNIFDNGKSVVKVNIDKQEALKLVCEIHNLYEVSEDEKKVPVSVDMMLSSATYLNLVDEIVNELIDIDTIKK